MKPTEYKTDSFYCKTYLILAATKICSIKFKAMKKELNDELTYKIIGCGMKVHNAIGSGFQEKIYQRALLIEMEDQGLSFARELEMNIYYKDAIVGTRRVDFFVEDRIMLELKAVSAFDDSHINQAINYCEAYNLPLGLLLNFGTKKLEYKRVYNLNHPDNNKNT